MSAAEEGPGNVRSRRWWRWLGLLVVLGVLVGIAGYVSLSGRHSLGGPGTDVAIPPTPAGLIDLVRGRSQGYDVIVLARVESAETGYDPTDAPPTWEPDAPVLPPHPYTNFRLAADRVLHDDSAGRSLIVTRNGHPGDNWDEGYPLEAVGQQYLYFLEYVPEFGAYIAPWDGYSRLIVDGDTVQYSNDPPEPVPFAQGTPPAAFIDAVATAVATVYPTPTQ